MSIEVELRYRKPRDEKRQIAFVSVSGVNAQVYEFSVGNVPAELGTNEAVQAYLETRIDEWHLYCLRETYVGAEITRFQIEGKTELEAFQDWVDDGHKNIVSYDEDEPIYEVITNHDYPGTHPKALEWLEEMEATTGWPQGKIALIKMIKDMI